MRSIKIFLEERLWRHAQTSNLLLLILLPLILTIGVPCQLRAQAVWGSISGYVTDPSGAAIPKANVSATEESTGVVTKVVSDSTGFYNITHITPGTYTMSVELSGFKRFVRAGVQVTVGSAVRLDTKLELGSVTQNVTVTAASPILNTQHTEVSTGFTRSEIESLPITKNNVTNLAELIPGVTKDTFQMGIGENPQQTDRVYVNGTWSGVQTYLLDGITNIDYGFSGIQVINPPQDSLQEVKITTSSYDPEFSNTAGMVMQYVTKSGTNQIHGSAYEYNQNSSTFAADPFTEKIAGTGPQGKGVGVQPFNWNQFGGSLGGPIKKNKIFLFGDFQGTRTIASTGMIATVPNAAWRQGDFSDVAATNPIFDPATGNPDGTGRTQFYATSNPADPTYNPRCVGASPCLNMIPVARFSQVATNLLGILPSANINQNTDNNYVGTFREVFNSNQWDVRNDWNLNDTNKFFVRYSYYKTYLNNPPLFGLPADGPTGGGLSPETANSLSQQSAANYTRTFSPTLVAEFRAGFNRFRLDALQSDSALTTNDKVGIPNINVSGNALTGGLAGINISGPVGNWFMGIPSGVGIPRFEGTTTYELVNNWMKESGNHQFRWGVDFRRQLFNFLSVNASSRGNFTFSNTLTATPSVANSGLGMAGFLLGTPSEFDRAIFTQFPGERQTRMGIYGQDVWRVTPKLTARIGLRWDYFSPITPAHPGGLADFDPATGNILLAGLGKISNSDNITTPKTNFGPRVGIAYQVTKSTVLRAGFSTNYFASGYDATFYHLTSFYPITAQQSVVQSNIFTPIFPMSQGPPPGTPPQLPSSGILPAPDGTTLKSRPFDWKTETMYSDNLTVQHQLSPNTSISVAYVGTWATHLSWSYNMNAAPPGSGPIVDRRPFYNLYGLTQSINMECNCSTSNYNSLQVSLNKRYSHDLSLMSNFTWAKALGYYGQYPVAYRALDYGVGGGWVLVNDRAISWTLAQTYKFPFGPGERFGANATGFAKALLAGWQFSGSEIAQSGLPLTPTIGNSAPLNADFGNLANRVPGCNPYDVPGGQTYTQWYNPACFSAPGALQIGDAAPGSLRGPGILDFSWALWKSWSFKTPLNRENTELSLRVEAFNVLNNTNAATPNGSQFGTTTPVDSAVAGQITALEAGFPMRELQFGLHLSW